MRVTLARAAERDLREIRLYIAADDPGAADVVIGKLVKAFLLIRTNPEIGRKHPSGRYREWSVPNLPYVIPYQAGPEGIHVIRVYHTRRLKPPNWQ
jgi:toxin ParE1/3/4